MTTLLSVVPAVSVQMDALLQKPEALNAFFVLASVITTVSTSFGVPPEWFSPLKTLSKFFIVLAMAGIGLNTDLIKLIKTGGKPIFLGLCCWGAISAVSIVMQHVLGIW